MFPNIHRSSHLLALLLVFSFLAHMHFPKMTHAAKFGHSVAKSAPTRTR